MAYPQSNWTPLDRHDPRVMLAGHACLPRRTPLSRCTACAEACPVGALTVVAGSGPELTGDCTGCGACATACPSEALTVQGFPDADDMQTGDGRIDAVECHRVPDRVARANALRIPCLAGLHDVDLMALARRGGEVPVELMDRGWCGTCPACGDRDTAPPEGARRRAHYHLASSRVPVPVVTDAPLPEEVARPVAMGAALRRGNSRRQLLRMFDPETHSTGAREPVPAATADPRQRLDTPRRRTLLAERDRTGATSAPPWPAVEVSENCCNTGICAALCPTAALTTTDNRDGLMFDPSVCIACGLCAAVCPHEAITLSTEGGAAGQLTSHRQATCRDCGRRFSPASDDVTHCEACEKSRRLGRAAFM